MQPQRNIALFSLAYDPFFGGAEIAAKEIASRLPESDFACITYRFNSDWKEEEATENMNIIRVGSGTKGGSYYGRTFEKIKYIYRAYKKAEELHAKKPFTHIWALMASYAGFAALLFKQKHPEIPLLLTLQEGDSEEHILHRVGVLRPWWQKIFKAADHVQAISSFLGDFAKRHGARAPITVIPNGVDLERFKAKKSVSHAGEGKPASPSQGGWRIITTSRLVHKNGIDILIRALSLLKKEIQSISFRATIVGAGPDEAKLKKIAGEEGIAENIEWITGQVAPNWIPHHLEKADIFVRPSRSEGLGNSFLEAMAVGLPVIGTPVGGIPDFLKSPSEVGLTHATGLFAKPEDSADLARQLAKLMTNDEIRERIAENGQRLIRRNYSWETVAAKIKNIFAQLDKSF